MTFEWQGRIDNNDAKSFRWHQQVSAFNGQHCDTRQLALCGFACDEGVKRNQGRIGAYAGPAAIRKALANLSCDEHFSFVDSADICCDDGDLEGAQARLAERVSELLLANHFPLVLGGGHEVAWGSFQGIQRFFAAQAKSWQGASKPKLGIINLDAHFDLRNPVSEGSSGTPFRQCQQWCEAHQHDFQYCALGISETANTQALFEFAREHQVRWLTDEQLYDVEARSVQEFIKTFVQGCDYLYLTICLDVFSQAYAPGVSAPAAIGLHPVQGIRLIKLILNLCAQYNVVPLMCDIAEMNPQYDRDMQTSKLAARLAHEVVAACPM